jgi:hypothetical protein
VRGAGAGRLDVEVRGATQPFLAVFLQAYDPNWQAYILPKNTAANWWTLRQTHAIPQRYHVLSDGYANAWWIAAKGSFTLALAYWPQGLLSFGWIVSWLTMLSCTCYAIVASSKARFRVARSIERRSLTNVTTRVPVE